MSQAQATQNAQAKIELPGQNLTLEETLRVMDVAREMRDQREQAEDMFHREDVRKALREKLLRSAGCRATMSPRRKSMPRSGSTWTRCTPSMPQRRVQEFRCPLLGLA